MKKKYIYTLLMACLFISVPAMQAQSIKGVLNSLKGFDFEGTWNYEGAAVEFKSNNLLKKAGGKVASSSIEKNLNSQLNKIGFEPGVTVYTFNADSTFTNTTGGRTIKGKYSYNSSTKNITLKYANHIPLKAKVSGSGSKMSLLFEANEFLSAVTFIGSHSGVSAIKGVTSILNSYDGMMVGLEFKK